jgi:hypothetical protein
MVTKSLEISYLAYGINFIKDYYMQITLVPWKVKVVVALASWRKYLKSYCGSKRSLTIGPLIIFSISKQVSNILFSLADKFA